MRIIVYKPLCFSSIILCIVVCFISSGVAVLLEKNKQTSGKQQLYLDTSHQESIVREKNLQYISDGRLLQDLFDTDIIRNSELLAAILRGFQVSENSLGDMNQDSLINIWDLIRIRNIYLGFGASPTSYELEEGDLTQDDNINQGDVYRLRDVLLYLAGIPYVVNQDGGVIIDRGIELSIHEGALESEEIFSINHLSPKYFKDHFGIDIKTLEGDSIWNLSGFRLESTKPGRFKKPPELTITLDSLPPCSFEGLNSVVRVSPDIDGDGIPEIVNVGTLIPDEDSLSLFLKTPMIPNVVGISTSNSFVMGQVVDNKAADVIVYVGEKIYFDVSGLSGRCVAHFVDFGSPDSLDNMVVMFKDSLGWYTLVPPHPAYPDNGGPIQIILENQDHDLRSEPIIGCSIEWNPYIPENPDSIIDEYFNHLTNSYINTRDSLINIQGISSDDLDLLLFRIDKGLQSIPVLKDSIFTTSLVLRNRISSIIDLSGVLDHMNENTSRESVKMDWTNCGEICHRKMNIIGGDELGCGLIGLIVPVPIGSLIDKVCNAGLKLETQISCLIDCDEWNKECSDLYIFEEGEPLWCPNIYYHRPKACFAVFSPSGVVAWGGSYRDSFSDDVKEFLDGLRKSGNFIARSTSSLSASNGCCSDSPYHPLVGAIVKADVPLLFNSTGVVNLAGNVYLPLLPKNSTIRLSIYDPKTGLFDPDVATFDTHWGEGEVINPLVIFNPDTTKYYYPIRICKHVTDEISEAKPRIEYSLPIKSVDVDQSMNVGFRSAEEMTLWIQNPIGDFVYRDSSIACAYLDNTTFNMEGTYKVTVTYGVAGGEGPFAFGTCYHPYPPTPYLCGNIVADSLYHEYSPYMSADEAFVSSGDTLTIQGDIDILFVSGGRLASYGLTQGITTPDNPIILGPQVNSPY